MSTRKKIIVGFVLLAMPCGLLIGSFWHPTTTVSDIEVLEQNEQFALVRSHGVSGRMYKSFADDFSEPSFLQWFGDDRWTTIDTLSPASPSLEDYVELRGKIFRGESDFLDNRIEASDGMAKFFAVSPTPQMVTSKSMLEHNRLWFVKGDDLWYRGKYLLQQGVPFTIADFQERGRHNSPGPRITIWDKTYLGYELKSGWKPKLRQTDVQVPIGEWFVLTVHLVLDEDAGLVQVWQNEDLLLNETIATLPASDSLLNALEVGITATDEAAEVWVDELEISHKPLR